MSSLTPVRCDIWSSSKRPESYALYGRVLIPPAVVAELNQARTPVVVRAWVSNRPDWLKLQAPQEPLSTAQNLDPGEREAIALAEELSADVLLMDDRDGRREAERRHLAVLGTLRVVADGAEHGFVDLPVALNRLRQTNFRASERVIQSILARDAKRRST